LLPLGAPKIRRLLGLDRVPRSGYLQRLLSVEVLAAGLEVDRPVTIVVVGIGVVVQVCAQTYVDSAERVDHVAEGDKVDRDVTVEGQPCDLSDLMLRRETATVDARVLLGDAADDAGVRHFVRRVDLVGPDPARIT